MIMQNLLKVACLLGCVGFRSVAMGAGEERTYPVQRTMAALAASTPEKPAHVRMLFYGQSIVGQRWHTNVIAQLKARYPSARLEVENRAIGGFTSPDLIRTAESDLYSYYPDILFFHVYGPLDKYEAIIRKVRATTTAEIVLWTSHLNAAESKDAATVAKSRADHPDARSRTIMDIARRYGCLCIDVRKAWCDALFTRGLCATNVLADGIHMNARGPGFAIYSDPIAQALLRNPAAEGPVGACGTIEEIPVNDPRVTRAADGSLSLAFDGNRVVAVSDGAGSGSWQVALDGRAPASYPEMFYNTRPSTILSWMPMVKHVDVDKGVLPVVEDWTLTYIDGTQPGGKPVHYQVTGSVTGPDGEGWNTNDFRSASGRACIRVSDFHTWQYGYFLKDSRKKHLDAHPGQKITWSTRALFVDPYEATQTADACTTLVQGCANRPHVLKLTPAKVGSTSGIRAFRVYRPARTEPVLVPAPQEQTWRNETFSVKAAASVCDVAKFAVDATLPAEGYAIDITPQGIAVTHADAAGAFYAGVTLRQLVQAAEKGVWRFPCGTVKDWPAFRWRGFMLDEGRHFFGKETVKHVLDEMAEHKLNVFHWHLTEDQGWRLDLPRFPELARYGSVRPASVAHGYTGLSRNHDIVMNGEQYGPFAYTPEDVKEILAYAAARHITVVPEIELPGHMRALLAAHPEFSCRGAIARTPRTVNDIEDDVLCAGNPAAMKYLEEVLDEVCALFPGSYVHIGGDECPKLRWKTCPKCQARIREQGLKDEHALQGWVTRHFTRYLAQKGRRAIGWDEVLEGDPAVETVVQNWRSAKWGIQAADKGHDVVVSGVGLTYFSVSQGCADDPFTYLSPGMVCSLERTYSFDPLAGMTAAAKPHVLGAECCMWSECTWNRYDLDYKLWPRACAFAETVWTAPAQPRRFADFESRVTVHRDRLLKRRVNCAPVRSAGAAASAKPATAPALVPAPQEQTWRSGTFSTPGKKVTENLARFAPSATLPPEGYRIEITREGIGVESADAAGAAHAMATLRQLAQRTGDAKSGYRLVFPQGLITDWPAYRWRGFMLDEGRRFFGKETVKRVLDQMADFKLNVFHWHLTEDQGWRLDLPRFPELVQYGAVRPASVAHGSTGLTRNHDLVLNGEKYGPFFYTAEDVREILAYAKARHIRVIPEIELPGHMFAFLAAHPEFSCTGKVRRTPRMENGIEDDVLCAGNDAAIRFLEQILDDVCALFPGEYVHIGGDECPKTRWQACSKCQARIKALGLKDEKALQGWVTRHFTDYLAKKGRRAIGWDEVYGGNPGPETIIQAWHVRHGNKYGFLAAEAGYPTVVSALHATYFSLPQGTPGDPFTYLSPGFYCRLETAYGFDPLEGLGAVGRKSVIGAECCMWSECTWNLYDLEFKLWPRAAAFAEVMWTNPKAPRDFDDFAARMAVRRTALIAAGVNCAPLK